MALFFIIFIVPLLIALAAFILGTTICWKELLIIIGVQFVVALVTALICYHSNTADTEIWNGTVAAKEKEWTSCEHSYPCRCRTECTGSGNNRSCSTVCDTCYRHFNDWDWVVTTSNKERIHIARIDSQGSREPPRFTKVVIGEPTAVEHSYTNYIKASPDSLFRKQGLKEKYQHAIPKYPEVFDYYRVNRIVSVNGAHVDPGWNKALLKLNAELGANKQVNILVVLTKNLPGEYFHAINEAWIGGKKNDLIVVVGLDGTKPVWAEVMAWTNNEMVKVAIKNEILALDKLTVQNTIPIIKNNTIKYYERKPMEDFAYLKASITPTGFQWVISLIIGFIVSIGLSIYFHINETFIEYRGYHGRYRRGF